MDIPVTEVELEFGVASGITMQTFDSTLVPPFEEHEARLQRNISLEVWYDQMDHIERAFIVAMYRTGKAMKNLQTEAEIRHSKMKTRR